MDLVMQVNMNFLGRLFIGVVCNNLFIQILIKRKEKLEPCSCHSCFFVTEYYSSIFTLINFRFVDFTGFLLSSHCILPSEAQVIS